MATLYDLAGTTNHSFKIGIDGITVFYGENTPTQSMGNVGDVYIQTYRHVESDDEVDTYAQLQAYDTSKLSYGFALRVNADETKENKEDVYQWSEGNVWNFLYFEEDVEEEPFKQVFGRVYYKCAKNSNIIWDYIRNYTFDEPIIKSVETFIGSNDFKVSLQSAINTTVVASTKANDYDLNHSQYGVTRFATDTEVTNDADKYIVETPKQINTKINAEIDERIVQTINEQSTTTTVPSASATYTTIHAEETRAEAVEENLQEQIDAIESRRDVADIVSNYATPAQTGYTTLKAYDKLDKLSEKDIIKVLDDEHNDNRETYYEFVEYIVETSSDLPTTGVTADERARVEQPTAGQSAYWKYNGSAWEQIDITTSQGTLVLWKQIGYVDAYTRKQIDDNLVHKTNSVTETITGDKTFTNNIVVMSNAAGATGSTTISNNGVVSLKAVTGDGGKIDFYYGNGSSVTATIDETSSGVLSLKNIGSATNATNSLVIATQGWVNDATLSTNVVHRTGDESIGGTKTFTSTTIGVTPDQPTLNGEENPDYNDKKLTTGEWVETYTTTRIGSSYNLPGLSTEKVGYVLAINTNAQGYTWKYIKDYTKLSQLEDTAISSPTDGQVLIYDSTALSGAGGWKNGRQTVATISYWEST